MLYQSLTIKNILPTSQRRLLIKGDVGAGSPKTNKNWLLREGEGASVQMRTKLNEIFD